MFTESLDGIMIILLLIRACLTNIYLPFIILPLYKQQYLLSLILILWNLANNALDNYYFLKEGKKRAPHRLSTIQLHLCALCVHQLLLYTKLITFLVLLHNS